MKHEKNRRENYHYVPLPGARHNTSQILQINNASEKTAPGFRVWILQAEDYLCDDAGVKVKQSFARQMGDQEAQSADSRLSVADEKREQAREGGKDFEKARWEGLARK